MTVYKKAYGKSGGALRAIIGKRSGWHKSDWRRVYKFQGDEYIKLRGKFVRLDNCPAYRVFEIMEDGEVRDDSLQD